MSNEEKILELLTSMQAEMKEMKQTLEDLSESHDEVRTSVNAILDWTDTVSTVVPIVPKIS